MHRVNRRTPACSTSVAARSRGSRDSNLADNETRPGAGGAEPRRAGVGRNRGLAVSRKRGPVGVHKVLRLGDLGLRVVQQGLRLRYECAAVLKAPNLLELVVEL